MDEQKKEEKTRRPGEENVLNVFLFLFCFSSRLVFLQVLK